MTKKAKRSKKNISEKRQSKNRFGIEIGEKIPEKYHNIAGLGIIVLALMLFLSPLYFGDKTFQSGDVITQSSYQTFFESSDNTTWNPYIFCGMPMFGSAGWYDIANNLIVEVRTGLTNLFNDRYAGYSFFLLILGFGSFYLMRFKKYSVGISLFTAISTLFSVAIISLLFEGHINRMTTLVCLPFMFLLLLKMQEKIKLLDVVLMLFLAKLLFSQWHVQIIFYIYFVITSYFVFYFIYAFIKKNNELKMNLVKSALIIGLITGLGFSMQYYRLGQMYEYTPSSTRGSKSVLDLENKTERQSDEEFYQYSTNWSFSPGEVVTFFVPSWYGFGHSIYKGPLTQNREVEVNTYFGQMPFTHTAFYMGIVVLMLAILGMILKWENPFIKFLVILMLVSLFLSFGRNFPVLYDLFYKYVPFFEKFRAPTMILHILQIFLPVAAGMGLAEIIKRTKESDLQIEKIVKNSLFVSAGLLVLSFVLTSALSNFFIERAQSFGEKATRLAQLHDYMGEMFASDVQMMFFLITATAGILWLYINRKITESLLMIVIIGLSIFDIWRIDFRALSFEEKSAKEALFDKPNYIKVIEDQNDQNPFRLINLKQDQSMGSLRQNSNFHMYFLMEDFYGYSSLKPRSYQDFIDVTGPANPTLWNMLNVKYVVSEKRMPYEGLVPISSDAQTTVHLNTNALGRAYFIDSVDVLSGLELINKFKGAGFNPKEIGFVETQLEIEKPDSTASIKILKYETTYTELAVNASGNNLVFFGNTFYNKGWHAKIDGVETPIYKVNHGFMGVVVPEGEHKVEFVYAPATFETGKYLSLVLNVMMFGLFGFALLKLKSAKKD